MGTKAAREHAEDVMLTNKIKKTDPDRKFRSVLAASTLAGDSVRNAAGEDLGTIDEIMIDIPSGRVAYAVLSFGGFLGMGDKLFAVPWSALKVDEDEKCFILNVDKRTIEQAPGFDKNNWPDMSDTSWGTELSTYYKVSPYWEAQKTFKGGGGL
jgi:sporulation protein YlmC with PRC-barrel domain